MTTNWKTHEINLFIASISIRTKKILDNWLKCFRALSNQKIIEKIRKINIGHFYKRKDIA